MYISVIAALSFYKFICRRTFISRHCCRIKALIHHLGMVPEEPEYYLADKCCLRVAHFQVGLNIFEGRT